MKKITLILLAIFLFSIPTINAQVNDDDEATAFRLKRKYPDERSAIVSDIEEYDFDIGKGDDGRPVVTAVMNQKIQFMSLREATMLQYGEFYNKFSSITKMKQYYKSGNSFVYYNRSRPIDKSATSGDIFYDDSRVKFFNIIIPKMGMGAMVEVEKKIFDAKYVTRLMFHSGYPTAEKIIRLRVPASIELDIREMNFAGYKVTKSTDTEGKKTVYSFSMKDLPPLNNEDNALPISYTFPHIIVLVKSFLLLSASIKRFNQYNDMRKSIADG